MPDFTNYGLSFSLEDLGFNEQVCKAIRKSPGAMYLINNGHKQSVGDAGALVVESKRSAALAEAVKAAGGDAAYITAKRAERHANALQGTLASGGTRGPRAVGLDAYIKAEAAKVLEEAIRQHNAKHPENRYSLPTGKGAAAELQRRIDSMRDKPVWAKITAAAEAAMAKDQESASEVDLGSLFAAE